VGRERPMKQRVTGLGNEAGGPARARASTGRRGPAQGGPARGGKLIIYNMGTRAGDQRVKESEWKMRRTRGVDGVKNRSGQWEGPGGGRARRVHYALGSH